MASAAGREEYEQLQRALAERAAELRAPLLAALAPVVAGQPPHDRGANA